MLDDSIYKRLGEIIPKERLLRSEPMSRHTSFRIGGPADLLVQINNEEELAKILAVLGESETDYILIGNGSNLLVADEGYSGVVLKLAGDFEELRQDEKDECLVHVGAARLMSSVSAFLTERGLSGFEFASGIPGSIGGAVFMNAGAYGGEMKDIVESVRIMPKKRPFDYAQGDSICHSEGAKRVEESLSELLRSEAYLETNLKMIKQISNADMRFGYRHSRIQEEPWIVLSVTLRLQNDSPETIKERVAELTARRNAKQPVNLPSAGSTFKRPAEGYAAALIEEAGLKGYRVGGAAVSEKHAGFVVNEGGASCEDVLAVMRHVRKTVFEKTGIELEPEVRLINCELLSF